MVDAPKTHYVGNKKGSDMKKKAPMPAPKPAKQPTKPMKKGGY